MHAELKKELKHLVNYNVYAKLHKFLSYTGTHVPLAYQRDLWYDQIRRSHLARLHDTETVRASLLHQCHPVVPHGSLVNVHSGGIRARCSLQSKEAQPLTTINVFMLFTKQKNTFAQITNPALLLEHLVYFRKDFFVKQPI